MDSLAAHIPALLEPIAESYRQLDRVNVQPSRDLTIIHPGYDGCRTYTAYSIVLTPNISGVNVCLISGIAVLALINGNTALVGAHLIQFQANKARGRDSLSGGTRLSGQWDRWS
jgi:hypothetical protein